MQLLVIGGLRPPFEVARGEEARGEDKGPDAPAGTWEAGHAALKFLQDDGWRVRRPNQCQLVGRCCLSKVTRNAV